MTLLLTDDQVKQLVSIDDVLPVVENMFTQEGTGLVTEVPRERIQAGPNYLAYMGGSNNYQEKMGMKVYSHCGDNLQFYVILLAVFIHVVIWFQLNGQLIWKWFKDNPLLLSLLGVPSSFSFWNVSKNENGFACK